MMPVAVLLAAVDDTIRLRTDITFSLAQSHNLKSVFFSVTGENFKNCILCNFPVLVQCFFQGLYPRVGSLEHGHRKRRVPQIYGCSFLGQSDCEVSSC